MDLFILFMPINIREKTVWFWVVFMLFLSSFGVFRSRNRGCLIILAKYFVVICLILMLILLDKISRFTYLGCYNKQNKLVLPI